MVWQTRFSKDHITTTWPEQSFTSMIMESKPESLNFTFDVIKRSRKLRDVVLWTIMFVITLQLTLFLASFKYKFELRIIKNSQAYYSSMYYLHRERICSVDRQLHQLADRYVDHDFVHPKANKSISGHSVIQGMKMKNVREISRITQVVHDINRPCGGNMGRDMVLLVLVHTRAAAFERRQAIRRTFGSSLKMNPKSGIYFVLAMQSDKSIQQQIAHESLVFNDIIQLDLVDHYQNCTLKGIAAIRWTALNCPHVKFMLKFDDDSFIRLNPLLAELDRVKPDKILGLLRHKEPVLRDPHIKWYISPLYYPYSHYPPYMAGIYFIPGHLTAKLYEAVVAEPLADSVPALPFDDAYNSGILAQKANIPLERSRSIVQLWVDKDKFAIARLQKYSVFYEELNSPDMDRLWRRFGEN